MLKSITTFIILLCLPILTFSQSDMKPSKDVVAIKALIKAETAAFWSRDYKAWSDKWIQEPHVIWTAATQEGVRQYRGWDEWSAEVKRFIKENPKPEQDNILRGKWEIRVYGTGAWVSFIQDWKGNMSRETRILEKQDGKWKIAFVETLYNLKDNKDKIDVKKEREKKMMEKNEQDMKKIKMTKADMEKKEKKMKMKIKEKKE